jgi:hypothetical protein
MSRPRTAQPNKPADKTPPLPSIIHWKTLGIGIMTGIFIFWLLVIRLGGRLDEISVGPAKFTLPNPTGAGGGVPFESTLLGLNYIASGWDPHIIDLRSAAEDGIPVWPGESLSFSELWVSGPSKQENLQVQVKFYVNDTGEGNCIGETPQVDLLPGRTLIDKITLLKYTQDNKRWMIQKDWEGIVAVTTVFSAGKEISANQSLIRFNRNGTAWLNPFSDAKFAEITYQVNQDPPARIDFRSSSVDGLNLTPGGQLCIQEIWYRSRNASKEIKLAVEATLGEFSESTYRDSPANPFSPGINQLTDYTPLCWQIPTEDTFLAVTLYQTGGTVMDFIHIPIRVTTR